MIDIVKDSEVVTREAVQLTLDDLQQEIQIILNASIPNKAQNVAASRLLNRAIGTYKSLFSKSVTI